jgi:hypothetical protein
MNTTCVWVKRTPCICAPGPTHFGLRGLHKARFCLYDGDVVFIALEGDIRAEVDRYIKLPP